jgi:uncharacterized repeat protein (TIGR01451 family)
MKRKLDRSIFVPSRRVINHNFAAAVSLFQQQFSRAVMMCTVLIAGTTPALAEGSRNMYPSTAVNGTDFRASLIDTGGTLLGGSLKTQTVFRVYANAGEYLLTGSTAIGNGGSSNIRIFNPGTVSGQIGQETLPSTADFSCNNQRTTTGNRVEANLSVPTMAAGLGVIGSRNQELTGPDTISNATTGARGNQITNSYVPCYYRAPSSGIYFVVFDAVNATASALPGAVGGISMNDSGGANGTNRYFTNSQGNQISAWDVTVRSSLTSTTNIDGRLFFYYSYIRTGNNGRPIKFSIYPVTSDGFRYQTELRGLDPNGFVVYGNNSGFFDTDSVTPLYHDLVGSDDFLSTIPSSRFQRPQFPTFLVSPTTNASLNTILNSLGIPLTPTAPSFSNLSYAGNIGGYTSSVGTGGTFTYTANVNHTYNIVISRDGTNFDPSNPQNRFLRGVKLSGNNSIVWNGKDNQGNNFPAGVNYKVRMFIVNGEYHFPLIDAENSPSGGPTLKLLNSPGTCINIGCDFGFYDDRAYYQQDGQIVGTFNGTIPQPLTGGTAPTTAFSGVGGFSTSGTQRTFTGGFGDQKGLDIWTYFSSSTTEVALDIIEPPNTGSPFNCDAKFYQIRAVGPTGAAYSQLFQFNRSAAPFTQTQIGTLPEFVLNGLGFNAQDGYLYATYLGPEANNVTGVTSSFGLYKIGQMGLISLGPIAGLPPGFQPTAADIDNNGKYYLTKAGGSNELYVIDIATRTATLINLSTSTPNLGDLSYNPKDGFLYGISGFQGTNEVLYKINPITGAVTPIPITGLTTDGNWGTSYFDVAGTFYAYGNEGAFYRIDLTTGAATLLSSGPSTVRSDGASCVFPLQRLDVVKSAGTPQPVASTRIFDVPYTVKVKNTSAVSIPNLQLTENLQQTFASGNPTITLSAAPSVSGTALTLNPNFNVTTSGVTDTRLLLGTDNLANGALSEITFTVRLTYPDVAGVPSTIQNNTVYASSSSTTNNPGYTFAGAGNTPIPPIDLLASDLSTNSNTLPATANGDTAGPTPITLPTVTNANVLLVKRITAINGDRVKNPNDNTPLNVVADDPTLGDNNGGWPTPTTGTPAVSNYLQGAIDAGKVKPGDTIEYTIYFLNAGTLPAPNVRICDRLTPNQIFQPDTYGAGSGIQMQFGNNPAQNLTNATDASDRTEFIAAPSAAPTTCNLISPGNDDGVVLVDVTGNTGTGWPTLTALPGTTGAGAPNDSFGYIRFVTRVKS